MSTCRGRHIDVIWSKGSRSRRLPVTRDVAEVLAACDAASTARFGRLAQTFFASSTGNPVTAGNGRGDLQPHLGPGRAAAPSGR